jgi:signal transduction histidine kinase
VVDEVLKVYRSKLQTRLITVERVFDESRPITVRRGELVQVFSNIIANSVDAMPQGGVLYIQIQNSSIETTEGLQVVIQDRGTGIPEEHLARAYEPFFTTKGNIGTGIGLWVTKQLVKRHGDKSP